VFCQHKEDPNACAVLVILEVHTFDPAATDLRDDVDHGHERRYVLEEYTAGVWKDGTTVVGLHQAFLRNTVWREFRSVGVFWRDRWCERRKRHDLWCKRNKKKIG
jgi:hypothetical protein